MIGWYVHHHGWGHVTRMRAIRPFLDDDVTVFSSLPRPETLPERTTWVQLPSDADPVDAADGTRREAATLGDVTAGGALHWAPVGHPGHRARLATMATWIAENPVTAFVVDVSVEVTMLVRLLGVPTVAFAQPGERTDQPHRLGYDLADRIIAPWGPGTIEATGLRGRDDRVRPVGAISRYGDRARTVEPDERRVLFLSRTLDDDRLRRTIALLEGDGWTVDSAGARDGDRVDDVWPLICAATVVVSAAGQNGVADLAAANARAVVIGQDRPFGEQEHTARVLAAQGYAQTAPEDASPEAIVAAVRSAAETSPEWTGWGVVGAAARAAAAIEEVVA
ncbi:glycosyltransferase [uncultured Microbacterium sp.]|uniref:glycosyltransferase n=1 Tax=uncultured Microbacterium sp. TaxID=191216 RepID=UPI0028DC9065|nr:glycosyltransferase [uncultured Microbacterium sp.]